MKKLPLLALLVPVLTIGCGDEPAGEGMTGTDETGDGDGDPGDGDGDPTDTGDGDTGDGDTGDGDGDPGDGDGDPTGDGDGDGDGDPGNPLPTAPVGEWLYVEIDGMFCRDGSPAGIGVRYANNDALLAIYMEGGGACFNSLSCLANPASIPAGKFSPGPYGGLFDNENPDNPMMDYNFVYLPYCTGDVFFGSTSNGNVPGGPQGQMFVGHDNVLLALERIVDTFPDTADVVATGESGGGFGAASNYATIADAFPNNDVVLIDDSGPIFRDEYLAPCLQQQFRDVWNVDASLPQDCPACFGQDGGGLYNYLTYVQEKYPNAPKGLISSHADSTISSFFGFGANNCTALFPSFPDFQEALYDLRDNVLVGPDFGTFFKTGNSHTYLSKSDYYTLTVDGVLLVDWVADLMAGDAAHVAP
ncbi:pectin acetylesterase-family hydrolase [Enhygromyxa salina]|nr:pectin acetylesterase-family hydrolase [Enhygromyxa salina]